MRILYHHRTGSKDGQAVHIEELTRALKDLGHEVVMVGPATTEQQDFGGESGLVAALKRRLPRPAYELLEFCYALIAYVSLDRAYREVRPDVLYERSSLFMPAGVWLKRRRRLPMLLEVNAPLFAERRMFGGVALTRLARWSEEMTWRGADYVLPVTRVLAGYVKQAGAPDERIVVIPNAINPERFLRTVDRDEAKRRLGLTGRLVLGFTGFMREWHGLDQVIDLLAELRPSLPVHLLLVGDGPVRASLEAQADRLGVAQDVTFTGVVERDALADKLAAFDLALQPAVRPYASPLKLFEYMALGCAIVAPRTPNIEEVLSDGATAVLFDADSPGALKAAIERVCRDGGLRARLGASARRAITDGGFTWKQNARRVEALMRQLQ